MAGTDGGGTVFDERFLSSSEIDRPPIKLLFPLHDTGLQGLGREVGRGNMFFLFLTLRYYGTKMLFTFT